MIKRIFDIVLAGGILILFAPVMLLCVVAILIADGRPVLFRQRRIGRGCVEFTMLKFRTMSNTKNHKPGGDVGSDTRVTKLGRFLRKTKLDELPQFWNVIVGDMSIVGPRPQLYYYVESVGDITTWKKAYSVRPGITAPASIVYRDMEKMLSAQDNPETYYKNIIIPKKLDMYIQYTHRQSLFYDIEIIYKTARSVMGKSYTKDDVL